MTALVRLAELTSLKEKARGKEKKRQKDNPILCVCIHALYIYVRSITIVGCFSYRYTSAL